MSDTFEALRSVHRTAQSLHDFWNTLDDRQDSSTAGFFEPRDGAWFSIRTSFCVDLEGQDPLAHYQGDFINERIVNRYFIEAINANARALFAQAVQLMRRDMRAMAAEVRQERAEQDAILATAER